MRLEAGLWVAMSLSVPSMHGEASAASTASALRRIPRPHGTRPGWEQPWACARLMPRFHWVASGFLLAILLLQQGLPLFTSFSKGRTELIKSQSVPDLWLLGENRNRAEITQR